MGGGSVQEVLAPVGGVSLEGALAIPAGASGLVLFAHGSGSSRHSPRNNYVARVLQDAGMGTFLFDLLTAEEDLDYSARFDIGLLTQRLAAVTRWVQARPEAAKLAIGYFGASTGAAAALGAAAELGSVIAAVVSRGGRPDLAEPVLDRVRAPTLLIVGELDVEVLQLNRRAYALLETEKRLAIVPGATHLFEEAGTLEQAAHLAAGWFKDHLKSAVKRP